MIQDSVAVILWVALHAMNRTHFTNFLGVHRGVMLDGFKHPAVLLLHTCKERQSQKRAALFLVLMSNAQHITHPRTETDHIKGPN